MQWLACVTLRQLAYTSQRELGCVGPAELSQSLTRDHGGVSNNHRSAAAQAGAPPRKASMPQHAACSALHAPACHVLCTSCPSVPRALHFMAAQRITSARRPPQAPIVRPTPTTYFIVG